MASKEDYLKFMSEVRKVSGVDMLTPDETGLVSIRVDDAYNVNLQFIEATGKVLCFVEVATLPSDASKAVYRDLLVGGLFGKDTAGGYFVTQWFKCVGEAETACWTFRPRWNVQNDVLELFPSSVVPIAARKTSENTFHTRVAHQRGLGADKFCHVGSPRNTPKRILMRHGKG